MEPQKPAPRQDGENQSDSKEARERYEPPRVESVKLSPEAAEALT